MTIADIRKLYRQIRPDIEKRITGFRLIWENASDSDLFIELAFCLFTPQSGARRCWRAVETLLDRGLIFAGAFGDIQPHLNIVRFRNNKTRYLLHAREQFMGCYGRSIRSCLEKQDGIINKRKWLVDNVKGIGYKEASHFLRNIGLGEDIAILDRHILKNLVRLGIIDEVPASMSFSRYHEVEDRLRRFAHDIHIPLEHLDFVLWYSEAGEVFK